MPWTPSQRNRLVTEKRILEHFFPGRVTWVDPKGDTKIEVFLNTNNGNKYCLRIYLKSIGESSSDFPNSVPDMVRM
jgi:tRNA A37 threonylcarbamoyladenosine synthetase subunit TsaC/SUA5/YrdC